MIDKILDQLFDWGFIDHESNKFKCTLLGLRVAQLYLDPLTAHDFIQLLEKNPKDEMVILTILSDAAEMRPLANVRASEETIIYEEFEKHDLLDDQVRAFKNAFIFWQWTDEKTDDYLFDTFGMPPGTFRTKLNIADWLLYACSEIARITKRDKLLPKLYMLRKRLKYGVKEELLPLVRITSIGRVRARRLYGSGIKNVEDMKATKPEKLGKLLGAKIAEKICKQLDIEFEKPKEGLEKYM